MESQVAFVSPNAFTNAGVALPASGPKSPNTCAAAARKRQTNTPASATANDIQAASLVRRGGSRLAPRLAFNVFIRPKTAEKSLDDAALCQYSSTIPVMNTKKNFPIFCFALPLLAAEPPQPAFHAVDIDSKIEIGYGVTVADVDGDGKPD